MPMREGVRKRDRKIRARNRQIKRTVFFRIKRRISDRRRNLTLRSLARLALLSRRRRTLSRRRV
jgi:hypothetical protein